MPTTTPNRNSVRRRRNDAASWRRSAAASDSIPPPPAPPTPEKTLLRRFWKEAAPYWSSDDKVQARMQLGGVFLLTLATTGISVGFNFLGRDFYNALANKDQEQLMKQLLYYLGAFFGGIPVPLVAPSESLPERPGAPDCPDKLATVGASENGDVYALPERPSEPACAGAVICVYYLKTGTCKYGATCRFDHPPPGEGVGMAASQAKSDSAGGKAKAAESTEE